MCARPAGNGTLGYRFFADGGLAYFVPRVISSRMVADVSTRVTQGIKPLFVLFVGCFLEEGAEYIGVWFNAASFLFTRALHCEFRLALTNSESARMSRSRASSDSLHVIYTINKWHVGTQCVAFRSHLSGGVEKSTEDCREATRFFARGRQVTDVRSRHTVPLRRRPSLGNFSDW